jgi:hypothetical protein
MTKSLPWYRSSSWRNPVKNFVIAGCAILAAVIALPVASFAQGSGGSTNPPTAWPPNRGVDAQPNSKGNLEPPISSASRPCKADVEQALENLLEKVSVARDAQGRITIGGSRDRDIDGAIGAYNALKVTIDICDDVRAWRGLLRNYTRQDDLKLSVAELLASGTPPVFVSVKTPIKVRIGDSEPAALPPPTLPNDRLDKIEQTLTALTAAVRSGAGSSGFGLTGIIVTVGLFILGFVLAFLLWFAVLAPNLERTLEEKIGGQIQGALSRGSGNASDSLRLVSTRILERVELIARSLEGTSPRATGERRTLPPVPPLPPPPPNVGQLAAELLQAWRLAHEEPATALAAFKNRYNAIPLEIERKDGNKEGPIVAMRPNAMSPNEPVWLIRMPNAAYLFGVPSPTSFDVAALTAGGDHRRAREAFGGVLALELGETALVEPAYIVERNGTLIVERPGVLRLPRS